MYIYFKIIFPIFKRVIVNFGLLSHIAICFALCVVYIRISERYLLIITGFNIMFCLALCIFSTSSQKWEEIIQHRPKFNSARVCIDVKRSKQWRLDYGKCSEDSPTTLPVEWRKTRCDDIVQFTSGWT